LVILAELLLPILAKTGKVCKVSSGKLPNMNEMGKYWKPGSVQPIAANIKESSPKATLSKGVLGMKFMKRSFFFESLIFI